MPSSDLVLNVRQVAGYDVALNAISSDALLIQRGGLGGPYFSISPAALVATALSSGGDMVLAGQLSVQSIQGGSLQFSNASFGLLGAQKACIVDFDAQWGTIQGVPIADQPYVDGAVASLANSTVWSFNGRRGDILLSLNDITCAGGAPIFSPRFQGQPRAETPAPWSHNTRLATTAFVHRNSVEYITNLLRDHPFVFSFNGRTGEVTLQPGDIQLAEAALLDSPPLTGTPTTPTPPAGDSSTIISNTQFVTDAINAAISNLAGNYAPINSPAFIGTPTALTAPPGTATGQLATTAFVMSAITDATAGVSSFNTRTGAVTFQATDLTAVGGALLGSPAFQGTPTAPTAPPGTDTNQIATCAWVLNELGGANIGVMSFNGRGGAVTLNTSDITAAGGAPAASPTFTGVPLAPTAATGTSTDQLATTAFVMSEIGAGAGVTSFMGRAGAITLTFADISAAGGLANPSPALTGAPTAPTASPGTSTTQIASTAFVAAAIAASVVSFNGRSGAVTLTLADVTSVGGAPLANPTFTGSPAAPTASPGTSTTQLATTAFVQAAITAGSFVTNAALTTALAGYLPLTGGNLTGVLAVATNTVDAAINLVKPPGNYQNTLGGYSRTGGGRWQVILGDNAAESGSNQGSNFAIVSLNDSGVFLRTPLAIDRASGVATFSSNLTTGGPIVVRSTGPVTSYRSSAGVEAGYVGSPDLAGIRMNNVATGSYIICDNAGNFIYAGGSGYAQKIGGGEWAAACDARIKTVKGDYAKGLDELIRLRPVEYAYKGNDGAPGEASPHASCVGRTFVGLTAQAVEPIFPAMVTKHEGFVEGRKVDDLRWLDAGELTYALINAVKQLALRIEALEAVS